MNSLNTLTELMALQTQISALGEKIDQIIREMVGETLETPVVAPPEIEQVEDMADLFADLQEPEEQKERKPKQKLAPKWNRQAFICTKTIWQKAGCTYHIVNEALRNLAIKPDYYYEGCRMLHIKRTDYQRVYDETLRIMRKRNIKPNNQ